MNEDELTAFLEEGGWPAGRPGNPDDGSGRAAAESLRALLDDEALWAEPAPGGADALVAAIGADASSRPSTVVGAEEPAAAPPGLEGRRPQHLSRRRRPQPGRRVSARGLVAVAAAAVVALVVGVVGGLAIGNDDGGGGQEFAVAGTELAPDASAIATVEILGSGAAIELDVHDLAPAPPGRYYQAWVKSAEGDLVTIGTFHMRGGDDHVELWAGVDLERYPTLTVTLQQEGAGQESSGEVVLTGEIGS